MKPLTYADIQKTHELLGKMETGRPTLIYHPAVIERAVKVGAMREDEEGRVWTVIPEIPPAHNIEVFASEDVDELKGFYVQGGADDVGKR